MIDKNEISSVAGTIRRETLIAVVVNCVIAAALTWISVDHSGSSLLVGGPGAGAFGILPGTFLFTLLLTLGLSTAIRIRMQRGRLSTSDLNATSWIRVLPRNLLLRALVLAVAATVIGPSATFVGLLVLAPAAAPFVLALTVNVIYFALLACLVVPVIVRSAAFHARP